MLRLTTPVSERTHEINSFNRSIPAVCVDGSPLDLVPPTTPFVPTTPFAWNKLDLIRKRAEALAQSFLVRNSQGNSQGNSHGIETPFIDRSRTFQISLWTARIP